ncbi:MAG: hypothetical protein EHM83_12080, partial [Burkholderiales bacterium]
MRKFGDGCGALLDALVKSGAMPGPDLFARLRVALETNSADAVRHIAGLLALDPAAVETALSRPARELAGTAGREIALIA